MPFDPEQHVPTAPEAASTEPSQLLTRLIAELDPLSRALLLLYLDERSYREIAARRWPSLYVSHSVARAQAALDEIDAFARE